MQCDIQLFAHLAERAGQSAVTVQLAVGATVADAIDELMRLQPSLQTLRSQIVAAVNHRYVPTDTILQAGDELALIPPVSGG